MTLQVTIAVDAPDQSAARRAVEAAGFSVVRFAALKQAAAATSVRVDGVRASAVLDMPPGLDPIERTAYVRGYAAGCLAYAKKHGGPSLQGRGNTAGELRRRAVDHEWERHPAAHKAAMVELKKQRERTAVYEAARLARKAPAA